MVKFRARQTKDSNSFDQDGTLCTLLLLLLGQIDRLISYEILTPSCSQRGWIDQRSETRMEIRKKIRLKRRVLVSRIAIPRAIYDKSRKWVNL